MHRKTSKVPAFGVATVVLTMRPNKYFSLTEREIRRLVSSQDMVGKVLKWKGEAGDGTGPRLARERPSESREMR